MKYYSFIVVLYLGCNINVLAQQASRICKLSETSNSETQRNDSYAGVKCVIVETKLSEKIEFYLSSNPRLTQDNDSISIMSDNAIMELCTRDINKVYFDEGIYKLVYMLDGLEYKTYYHAQGVKITPEDEPTKPDSIFSGWSEIPESMPAHDVVVYGSFLNASIKDVISESCNLFFDIDSFLIIKGLDANEIVHIYNLEGEQIMSVKSSSVGEMTLSLSILKKGVNIIKTKHQTFKITNN